jgi:hypothetical protein
VFDYFNAGSQNWGINDANGGSGTPLSSLLTAQQGMILDLTLNTATSYRLTLIPLSNPSAAFSVVGAYSGPINYVNFRLYDGQSTGPNDTANNLFVSSMTLSVPEPSFAALAALASAGGLLFLRRRK